MIEPHVPVWDKTERKDGSLSRSDFQWNAEANEYRCPKDKPLRSTGNATSADTLIYRSSVYDCVGCELRPLCCPNTTHRKIARQVNEAARDVAREIAKTPRYKQSRKDRKKVKMLIQHLKAILRLDRLRLRGLLGAQDEFLLAATAQKPTPNGAMVDTENTKVMHCPISGIRAAAPEISIALCAEI